MSDRLKMIQYYPFPRVDNVSDDESELTAETVVTTGQV